MLGLVLVVGTQAYADVFGRLHFSVKNAADEKPVANASIVLADSAGVRPPITLKTAADGTATSPAIEARPWKITTRSDEYDTDTRTVNVVTDTTTEVEVLMEPKKEQVIKVTGTRNLTKPSDTTESTTRSQADYQKFPNTVSNHQSLAQFLQQTAGLALDSVGQEHPLGEHAATTIYINGMQLPGAFQGRAGQILPPTAIQNVNVITGGFAPEYGRETAAILNIALRSGPIDPFVNWSISGGSYGTCEAGLTAGGQLGANFGDPDENGKFAKRFSYLVDVNARQTNEALEPPQPTDQTAHNAGQDYTSLVNVDWRLTKNDTISIFAADNPATTEIANRTGYPAGYPGGGYGFLGSDSASSGLPSQQQEGQNIWQTDHNEYGALNYRRDFDNRTQLLASFALIHTDIDINNNSPKWNLDGLPEDNSIEYDPVLIRNNRDAQFQTSLSRVQGQHTLKAGILIDRATGLESYYTPAESQLALDYLYALSPELAPKGYTTGQTDSQGNPVFIATGPTPTVYVSRQGYYNAAYVQDTWGLSRKFTANYGVRYDYYTSEQVTTSSTVGLISDETVSCQQFSPRLNLSYALDKRDVLRADADRLMIVPPTAQGAAVGTTIQPEQLWQFDVSAERQLGAGQTASVRGFYKHIQDQLDVGLLIPGTQIGAFVTDNIQRDEVHGALFSYDLRPVAGWGTGAYVAYQYALAKPGGMNANLYNDHDQLHTLSTGVNYTLKHGESAALVFNYGSGFYSSTVDQPDGPRAEHREWNLALSSAPNVFHTGMTAKLEIENIFDQRDLINFDSGFSGTRFQLGRRIVAELDGKF